jgi:hypothetical protein
MQRKTTSSSSATNPRKSAARTRHPLNLKGIRETTNPGTPAKKP